MPAGNLTSMIFELFLETPHNPIIKNVSLPEKYIFENGGRELLLDKYGLSLDDIKRQI